MNRIEAVPRLSAMRHVPLHERVYGELRDAIMSSRLKPGEAITHRGLAQEIGTSVMPIRDAVHRLVSVRALEVLSNRTVRVPVLTEARFVALTSVRIVLESFAAETAASRMKSEDIAALEEANRSMEAGRRRNDKAAVFRDNRIFHFLVYQASGNDLLVSLIEDLWLLAGPYISLPWDQPVHARKGPVAVVSDHHRALIKAIRAKDPLKAGRALRLDIQETAATVLRCPLFTQPTRLADTRVRRRRRPRTAASSKSQAD